MSLYARNRMNIVGTDYKPENGAEFSEPLYKLTFVVQGESAIFQVAEDRPSNFGPIETTEMELLPGSHSRIFPRGNVYAFRIRSRSSRTSVVWVVAYPVPEE